MLLPMQEESRVELPSHVGEPVEVFVNGVLQQEGPDYRREPRALVFSRRLSKEGRLGFWRWLSLFLGIAGTYRQNDSVDVVYELGGRRLVATGLPITSVEPVEDAPHRQTREPES
jgi:hypothetical protein